MKYGPYVRTNIGTWRGSSYDAGEEAGEAAVGRLRENKQLLSCTPEFSFVRKETAKIEPQERAMPLL